MPSRSPSSSDTPDAALRKARDQVFETLAPLDYVSGAGTQDGSVAVYLSRALSADEQQHVAGLLGAIDPKPPVHFVVSGAFRKQDT